MLAANDVAAARVAADELVKIAMRRSAPFLRALSSRASGAVLLAEGNARSALVELRQSWSIWCELQAPYEASRVRLLIALAAGTWETKTTPSWSSMRPDRRFNSWALRSSFRVQKVFSPKEANPASGPLTGRELQVLRLVNPYPGSAAGRADSSCWAGSACPIGVSRV